MEKMLLIKYGELTTKKANRNHFIKALAKNIKFRLVDFEYTIEHTNDRMYIFTESIDEVSKLLQDVFGIYSIVIAYKISSSIEEITEKSLQVIKDINFTSFKVETKRSDKNFPINSTEVSRIIGGTILKNIPNIYVDVNKPELLLKIEIRKEYTYLYTKELKGAGGYPVQMDTKALLMLSGGIDSPVAGYMALKRGLDIECIYFESPPHTSEQALNKVEELTRVLTKYKASIKLHVVPFTKLQEAIYRNCEPTYMVTILRRMMYRISEQVANRNKALAIVNGECIGQVASQTLTSMSCINSVTTMPIIRPLACFDKEEIIALANKIGTYDISILPYEDCCTIFVPKHPVINPTLEACLKNESKIDYEQLITETVDKINTIIIKKDKTNKYEGLL